MLVPTPSTSSNAEGDRRSWLSAGGTVVDRVSVVVVVENHTGNAVFLGSFISSLSSILQLLSKALGRTRGKGDWALSSTRTFDYLGPATEHLSSVCPCIRLVVITTPGPLRLPASRTSPNLRNRLFRSNPFAGALVPQM